MHHIILLKVFKEALSASWAIQENYSALTPVGEYKLSGTKTGYAYLSEDQKTIVYRTYGNSAASKYDTSVATDLSPLGINYDGNTKAFTVAEVYNKPGDNTSGLKIFYKLSDVFSAVAKRDADAIKEVDPIYIVAKASDFTNSRIKDKNGVDALKYTDWQDYKDNSGDIAVITHGSTSTDNASVDVTANVGDADWADWDDWTFNGNMDGDLTVYPYTVTTEKVEGKDGVYYLKSVKEEVPTIYAFDFMPRNYTAGSANEISNAWNYSESESATAAAIGTTGAAGFKAETGRGNQYAGIRYDVVSDWINFLDDLAINKDNGYNESWTDFRSNYLDMFYSDPVYDIWTGQQFDTIDVDLYNIEGLLSDIYELNNYAAYSQANTSELLYLMQQYDKYIGDYIDKAEVASDDWGDLLLSILDAATEEDFRSASEYRYYTNYVETLRTAYETATTAGMIKAAEEKMYELLVEQR